MDEQVNIVNAEVLLRERGIKLTAESRSEMGAFKSAITAELDYDGATFVVGGTLFGNDMQRLIRLQDYRLEAYLDGVLLVFIHEDVPGIIGTIGTVFGKHNVNIAQMAVGRATGEEPGGQAIGVLNLDGIPPREAIEDVLRHEGLHKAYTIELPPRHATDLAARVESTVGLSIRGSYRRLRAFAKSRLICVNVENWRWIPDYFQLVQWYGLFTGCGPYSVITLVAVWQN